MHRPVIIALALSLASGASSEAAAPKLHVTFDSAHGFQPEAGAVIVDGKIGRGLKGAVEVAVPAGAISSQGTVCLWVRPSQRIGYRAKGSKTAGRVPLLRSKSLTLSLVRTRWGVAPSLKIGAKTRRPAATQLCFLAPNVWYHLAFAWDLPKGEGRFWLNGVRQCVPRGMPTLHAFPDPPTTLVVGDTTIAVDDLGIYGSMLDDATVAALLKGTPLGPFMGEGMLPGDARFDVSGVTKELVYECTFDDDAALDDWRLEGPGCVWVQDGKMLMTSQLPDRGKHIVNWCQRDFPADFVCEWDFRRTVDVGLTIVFFCARGKHGEDIFASSLAPRDGTFRQYILGDINSYHISYYANGRESTNMRKNSAFYLTAIGKDRITPTPVRQWHKITLYKRGAQIRMAVDGVLTAKFDDDGKTYMPVWGSGKIGLRQMAHTHTGMYDNFRVYRIVK